MGDRAKCPRCLLEFSRKRHCEEQKYSNSPEKSMNFIKNFQKNVIYYTNSQSQTGFDILDLFRRTLNSYFHNINPNYRHLFQNSKFLFYFQTFKNAKRYVQECIIIIRYVKDLRFHNICDWLI